MCRLLVLSFLSFMCSMMVCFGQVTAGGGDCAAGNNILLRLDDGSSQSSWSMKHFMKRLNDYFSRIIKKFLNIYPNRNIQNIHYYIYTCQNENGKKFNKEI